MDAFSGNILACKDNHELEFIPTQRKMCYMKKVEGLGSLGGWGLGVIFLRKRQRDPKGGKDLQGLRPGEISGGFLEQRAEFKGEGLS